VWESGGTWRSAGVDITESTAAKVPAVKLKFSRRNTMKSSTQDQAEGKFHQVKGTIKEIAGKVGMSSELEAEGKDEKIAGKVQEKIGEVKEVLGK
jgi:uncharacterized protein YjbJ (UPF0337 family)